MFINQIYEQRDKFVPFENRPRDGVVEEDVRLKDVRLEDVRLGPRYPRNADLVRLERDVK